MNATMLTYHLTIFILKDKKQVKYNGCYLDGETGIMGTTMTANKTHDQQSLDKAKIFFLKLSKENKWE